MKRVFWMPSSRATVRRDVDAEVAFHLEGRIDELVAQGLSREEAEREAVGRFGDQARVRAQLERIDEVARGRQARSEWLGDLARDVRFAVRSLVQHPMYALAVIATLALGIGANTSIFSVADALLFRPPPYPRPSELVSVWGATGGEYFGVRDRTRSFASVAAYSVSQMNIGDETNSERAEGAEVSENLFATFGVRPARGRGFSRGSNAVGAPREVILSDACWRARFGSDTNIVGRTILVDGVSRSVVGVMPEPFHFPSLGTQLWIQSVFDPTQTGNHWGWGKYRLIARMNRGVTLGAARADLKSITPFLRDENPVWNPGPGYGADATVTLLQATLAGPVRTTLLVLLAVVFALLLIACANVANLVLVRSIGRASEFAVRTALGCSRGRMLRQLLTESLVLAGAGGAGGVALAWAGVRALVSALPPQIPHTAPITVDARVLAFTASLTIVSAIAFGLMPALRAVRSTPGSAVPRSRGASRDAGHRRLADALTVVQLALAVVLVAGSGLLLRSFDALRRVDPGFAADHVVAARVTLSGGAYREPAKQSAFLDALLGRVQSAPGVTSVAAVNRPPLRGPVYGSAIRVEGQFEDVKRALPVIEHQQSVTPGYFATMGIPVVRGREFTSGDRADTPPVAIISASVVRRFWPNQDPVGKRIGMPFESPWITIVGVAADVKQDSLSGAKEETVYVPMAQSPDLDVTVVARTTGDVAGFTTILRAAVAELDRSAPVSDVRTMSDIVSASLARSRFTVVLLTAFALVALVLAAVGIYGVVSFVVLQRTRELGVRMALGATPRNVLRLVLGRGAALAATGVAIGVAAAIVLTRLLAGLLYGVSATDALTFVVAPMLLFGVTMAATWIPARRAVQGDPLIALRGE